jgi:hypothetical protein
MRILARAAVVAALGGGLAVVLGTPAHAGHTHFVLTPTGRCQQVATGSTAITDPEIGAFHAFHENVHLGATESATAPDTLGDGHAAVNIYKDACPA